MYVLYPGQGLGITGRPVIGFTLGFAPFGSVLPPITVESSEPTFDVRSRAVWSATTTPPVSSTESGVISDGQSLEPTGDVHSVIDVDGVRSKLPAEQVESEEPDAN